MSLLFVPIGPNCMQWLIANWILTVGLSVIANWEGEGGLNVPAWGKNPQNYLISAQLSTCPPQF